MQRSERPFCTRKTRVKLPWHVVTKTLTAVLTHSLVNLHRETDGVEKKQASLLVFMCKATNEVPLS